MASRTTGTTDSRATTAARARPSDPTISTRSLQPVLEHVQALGIDRESVVGAAGAASLTLADPDARVPHRIALAIWKEAAERSGDADFGLHTAERIHPGAFDVVDYVARSSATLLDAFERLSRYHRALHDAATVRVSLDDNAACISHVLPAHAPPLPRQPAEFIVAGWLVVARQATGADVSPLEVRFRHPAPPNLAEHRRVFRCPVSFMQPVNELVLARDVVALPLVKADAGLCAVLEHHMRDLLERLPSARTFVDQVREAVAADLARAAVDAAWVAQRMGMSARTLQRSLQADGTSFREVVDLLRRDLATRYLGESDLAIAEVAFLLGFSEPSAFHRAFRRWHGTTPALFRSKSRGGVR